MRDNPEFSAGLIEPLDTASAALEGVLDVLPGAQEHVEVSAIIPCLNEERTLGICIEKIQRAFASAGIRGEIVVGDNGSSDGSIEIAMRMGARVAHQPVKGYGAALQAAANAARGRYLVMADADDSYDWSDIPRFVAVLREGADLVMGDRFAGGIEAGAMPALHRYFGNPVLSAIGRVAHATPIRDFHCGMRGFTREAYRRIAARSPGMEFASEMVINAQRAGLAIAEVPIRLYPDKRDRRPHLRSFRDGWRHLRLIVAHAPDRLYLAPGLALMLAGLVGLGVLARGPVTIAGQYFGIHWVALSTMATLIGLSAILLGTLAKVAIATYQPLSRGQLVPWLLRTRPVEALIATGAGLAGLGILADGWLALHWLLVGGGMEASVHLAFILTTACVAGVTMVLAGFVLKLLLDNLSYRDA
ncbi:glycosyltransferase family 2 protein [Novosphingobium sp. YJ-S2-02]|uniref:Glycosyltransferase family 2 protein n=1 Tax=Novosphingobium aureum TaxID=2792964 RepID=A0A931HDE6_9SPHN|nr:glycosyltransferase family 2 protein [Novosphingobium aureum]MBH0114042.1 glycosyltransferase family 2 protein [Novosphingobium aureum]